MDCDDCLKRLYAFLDAELTEDEVLAVRSHIAGCEDCGDNFGFEKRFLEQLKEWCTSGVAPIDLRERVIALVRGGSPPAT